LRVFVDPNLLQYGEVWAAAGTWKDNFSAAPADIVRVAGGVVTDLLWS
jgi:prolyl-tRNA editing enzyme YbaK/EbsC (Cys-tRNA(Pro) deacylase)